MVERRITTLNTDSHARFQDRLVLEHIVGYIQKLSDESQRGFNCCANEVLRIAQTLPLDSEQRLDLEYLHRLLVHMSERMEYIDAHKAQPWDEMKYRGFINSYCPVKPGGEDDE